MYDIMVFGQYHISQERRRVAGDYDIIHDFIVFLYDIIYDFGYDIIRNMYDKQDCMVVLAPFLNNLFQLYLVPHRLQRVQ